MKYFSKLLEIMKTEKDGITTLITVVVFCVAAYQYFEIRSETRIDRSLSILKQREQATFVTARTYMLKKWVETPELFQKLSASGIYTNELIEKITQEIHADPQYRIALFDMSTYYSNAAACGLDGLCDLPTLCASLFGEIQEYTEVNEGYIAFATTVRFEDAKSLTLSLPEFGSACEKRPGLNLSSRNDLSTWCSVNLYFYRRFSLGIDSACSDEASAYDIRVEEAAERIRKILQN